MIFLSNLYSLSEIFIFIWLYTVDNRENYGDHQTFNIHNLLIIIFSFNKISWKIFIILQHISYACVEILNIKINAFK